MAKRKTVSSPSATQNPAKKFCGQDIRSFYTRSSNPVRPGTPAADNVPLAAEAPFPTIDAERRFFDSVVVPQLNPKLLQEFQSGALPESLPTDRQPFTDPSSDESSNVHATSLSTSKHGNPTESAGRSARRRTTQRYSLKDFFEDDEDRPSTVRKKRRSSDEVSDFSIGADDNVLSVESDDHGMSDAISSGSEAEPSDEDEDLLEKPKGRTKKTAAKRTTQQTSSKAKVKQASLSDDEGEPLSTSGTKHRMSNLCKGMPKQLDPSLPPIADVRVAFSDMTKKAFHEGLDKAIPALEGRALRIATMCSGTESPLLALYMIQDALRAQIGHTFEAIHLFSAEIVPYKQAYIERNFNVPVIFRDITELTAAKDRTAKATTAYGAEADVPGNVDILIAGTACVDYSLLNNKKKTIDDNGESGDTFRAVLAYAKVWRPHILILENVFTAPWDDMLGRYEAIGYKASGVLADTKNFYLPQTRQRGYMFCVNTEACGSAKQASAIAKKWVDVMEALRRPASSPASAFTLSNDDPAVLRSRALVARRSLLDDILRDVDWSKCALRHIQYRREQSLGNGRPFTSWQESGYLSVPDYADISWFRGMVERIWDMLDCSLLRKAISGNGGYDIQYKTRIINVSQNVDRNPDTTPSGISPCITPSGIFFQTDRGGAISPYEALLLQGLLLDRISFTTETKAQIQDMAGNAMSSTVVGAAILAALASTSDVPLGAPVESDKSMTSTALPLKIQDCDVIETMISPASQHLDIQSLLQDALQSSQKCFCEGPFDISRKDIQICADCDHTTCLACGGKPVHNYRAAHTHRRSRMDPTSFRQKWEPMLPSHLSFNGIDDIVLEIEQKTTNADSRFHAALRRAVSERFRFSRLRRGRHWIATWTSDTARLELHFRPDGLRWYLFAEADQATPIDDFLRAFLARPIAQAHIADHTSLFNLKWQWRYPAASKRKLTIEAVGEERTASWMARLQLPGHENQTVPNIIRLSTGGDDQMNISGEYGYLPQCGTASECLYKRLDGAKPRFLMLDPDPIADSVKDAIVVTDDLEKKAFGESREIFGRFSPKWRPWLSGTEFQTTSLVQDCAWLSPNASREKLSAIDASLDLSYIDVAKSSVTPESSCHHAINLVTMGAPSEFWTKDNPSFDDIRWLFTAVRAALPIAGEHSLVLSDTQRECKSCLPPAATLKWKWTADQRALRPYEDPALATKYEASLKSRPPAYQLHSSGSDGRWNVSLRLNLLTLAHRAQGKLTRLQKGIVAMQQPQFTWTVDPNYAETSTIGLPTFTLQNNDRDNVLQEQPDLKITLWPKQQRSLAWMLRQEENNGPEYVIEEVEEAIIPSIDWRIEVKARQTHQAKGGIQASHPGFGKTICTLALVQTDYQKQASQKDILANMRPPPQFLSTHGPTDHAATLVIAPRTLIKQWGSEVEKVLGKQFANATILVNTTADLAKHEISNFLKAKIIVMNQDVLTSESYVKRLAAFAGVPEPIASKGRQYAVWLEFVNKQVFEHVDILRTQGHKVLNEKITALYNERVNSEAFTSTVPSKRFKGQAYADKQGKRSASSSKNNTCPPTLDTSMLKTTSGPLFEMFRFNRIVIDEFSYLDPKNHAAIRNLKADKRWALSATAKLQDPYDIALMADLIGVTLRVSENAPGALSTGNLKKILDEKTDFEQFQTFRTASSLIVTKRTYELAQRFLDAFVRQNILEFDDFPYHDHLVPASLTQAHRLVYTELSQHLNSADMRIKKTKNNEDRDRDYQISDILSTVKSAEEALVRLAANFDERAYDVEDGSVTLATVAAKRKTQAAEVKQRLQSAIYSLVALTRGKKEPGFNSWKSDILQAKSLGDADTTKDIAEMFRSAEKQTSSLKCKTGSSAVKDQLSETNDLAKQYVAVMRSIRFVRNAQTLLESTASGHCDTSACQRTTKISLSSLCGHLVCSDCCAQLQKSTGLCRAVGCNAPIYNYHLLHPEKLQQAQPESAVGRLPGAKVKALIDLLLRIKDQKDQAILFVQYPEQIEYMEAACKASAITSVPVRDNASASAQVTRFQTEQDPRNRSTVIILNASDESAAGVNLTNANHVLFMSPLLTDSQYSYDASMAQAVGRVRRPGQEKDIHVYRLVALDTIDVDILEHRERRKGALSELGAGEFDGVARHEVGTDSGGADVHAHGAEGQVERTQLIKDHQGKFRLVPKSWLIGENDALGTTGIAGRARVMGYEDFSSLVKFSKAYSEDD